MELGIQSYCLRGIKENKAVADAVKACGLRRIELCGVHTRFDDPAAFGQLAADYRAWGVAVVSIGVNGIGADRDAAVKLFECAKAAGLKRMSVNFPMQHIETGLRLADELSERYGILCGIHNHGGRHALGSAEVLRWAFGKCSSRIGLNLDTAWALDSRENPVEMVKTFADRLHLIHIKDFIFRKDRTPEDVVVGTGNLDLRALDAALREANFGGEAILEYEGHVDNPLPALRDCVRAVADAMTVVTVP